MDDFFKVSKKNPWEGVEFAEFIDDSTSLSFTGGKVYKILTSIDNEFCFIDDYGRINGFAPFNKEYFKPSTEKAYVDQLKKQAFERFGEIKMGDRFELNGSISQITDLGITSWIYRKETDAFGKNGVVLYQNGKWAERVKERIEVTGITSNGYELLNKRSWEYAFRFLLSHKEKDAKEMHGEVLPFLAKQLEKYLNGEIES